MKSTSTSTSRQVDRHPRPLRQRQRRCSYGISSKRPPDDGEHPAQRSRQRRSSRIPAQRVRILSRFCTTLLDLLVFRHDELWSKRRPGIVYIVPTRSLTVGDFHATHQSAYKKKLLLQPRARKPRCDKGQKHKAESRARKPRSDKGQKHKAARKARSDKGQNRHRV